ncbi:DEAD/DEAH box helicase [Jeotgalibacillus sp. R-1-5s-1]|uniref:DEAD/DEAH box helicase n=1 Tax=Jeotgalibacillus sp. R-1-5s-1 TaxID=2555897 RepID=UPI00141A6D9B|nr:SNF2-related protein [Jeotgalibacillus sp. R-1-5s-1]
MEINISIGDKEWRQRFFRYLNSFCEPSSPALTEISYELKHTSIKKERALSCLQDLIDFSPMPHQISAAEKVLFEMDSRAILADEVGLGKTIEAGLIIKELLCRKMVKKVLILVPSSLAGQWQKELWRFTLPSIIHRGKKEWRQSPITIASIDLVKREPFRSEFQKEAFDLLLVDEAHKLSNPKTLNHQFVASLKSSYRIFLTATPVQNKTEDLYHLSKLLHPSLFESKKDFKELIACDDKELLKKKMDRLMIRSRRNETDVKWTKRKISVLWIDQLPYEKSLYQAVENEYMRMQKENLHSFSHLALLRQGCSSSISLLKALRGEKHDDFCKSINVNLNITPDELITAKAQMILKIVKEHKDKVLIFTQYRATQLYLHWFLKQNGISSVLFRGGFKKGKKQWMTDLFRDQAEVMVATEAGSEGLNLQFCHCLIHADLPWNPMKLEQRTGRVHRIGQSNDVNIYYLLNKNTIEERIWRLLKDKMVLFETIVGEHDHLLSGTTEKDLDRYLNDAILHSRSEKEMKLKLDHLESVLKKPHHKIPQPDQSVGTGTEGLTEKEEF